MSPAFRPLNKAPWYGAFFVLALWLSGAAASECAPPPNTERVQVRYVHDGDTLTLRDNRKIRLIGVNTPEVADRDRPAEKLALRARERLRQWLFTQGNQARLLYGREKRDHYGRLLAHLWLPDGSNLTAKLLREGLGWAIVIPPNTRFLDCHLEAEQSARQASRGVWGLAEYAPAESRRLELRDSGFRLVRGRVVRVNHGAHATWINLEGRFAIRIPDDDLHWFRQRPGTRWLGKRVEVRGWLNPIKGELRVTVHHPAMIRLLD